MKKVSDPSGYARFSGTRCLIPAKLTQRLHGQNQHSKKSRGGFLHIGAASPCTRLQSYKVRDFFTSGQFAKSDKRIASNCPRGLRKLSP